MPNTSNRKSTDRSNHGVAGRRLVDRRELLPREDRERELFEREELPREDLPREEFPREDLERVPDLLLVLLEFLDGARLIVLRLAIAQMFSSPGSIIPCLGEKGQPDRQIETCVLYLFVV